MTNPRFSPIDRRGFLCFSAVAPLLCAAGCGGEGEPAVVNTPPAVKRGARDRLEKLKAQGEAAAAKNQQKK
jgi:hypothetical protein